MRRHDAFDRWHPQAPPHAFERCCRKRRHDAFDRWHPQAPPHAFDR
jgi:hypothetical protein